jgi:hypothetical protein
MRHELTVSRMIKGSTAAIRGASCGAWRWMCLNGSCLAFAGAPMSTAPAAPMASTTA